jgi:N-glycosylase/DNA lyase
MPPQPAWQPLADSPTFSPPILRELLDGGQTFRWQLLPHDSIWQGHWAHHLVQLRLDPTHSTLAWRALTPTTTKTDLSHYLALETDWPALTDALPWRSDPQLATALTAFPNLRLLRQPFGETLLCFLCSATKQIPQIKQMVALLAHHHGAEIAPGYHRLPTWAELAAVPEPALRQCQLGFRARTIAASAAFLAERPGWLEETETLPYPDAKTRLLELPGVGEKIADCVLLFGAGKLDAFPVDTWIIKTLARRYALEDWSPTQLTRFGRVHFGPAAGLAQQFLFAHERALRHTSLPG